MQLFNFLKNHTFQWILIISAFLVLRIIYILQLPLMEAESSNIRYGQVMVLTPELRWISMTVGPKQPLAYWMFGMAKVVFSSLVIAPRMVSVGFGIITLLFLYIWTKQLFGRRVALISALLLTLTPLFIHFQSLALMESITLATTTACLWSISAYARAPKMYHLILCSIAVAVGFWTKTNTLAISVICFITFFIVTLKHKPFKIINLLSLFLIPIISIFLCLPLILHPNFHKMMSDVSTFSFSISELLQFPFSPWLNNITHFVVASFIYIGPLFYIGLYYGLRNIIKNKQPIIPILVALVFFSIPILLNKVTTTRYYITGYIPLLPIVALGIDKLRHQIHKLTAVLLYSSVAIFGILTLTPLVDPRIYFQLFPTWSPVHNERGYALGWSSGYATKELVQIIDDPKFTSQTAIFGVPDIPGNPTDYLLATYFTDKNKAFVFVNNLKDLPLLPQVNPKIPRYFITRNNLPHEDILPYLTLQKEIKSPATEESVQLYEVHFPIKNN